MMTPQPPADRRPGQDAGTQAMDGNPLSGAGFASPPRTFGACGFLLALRQRRNIPDGADAPSGVRTRRGPRRPSPERDKPRLPPEVNGSEQEQTDQDREEADTDDKGSHHAWVPL